MRTFYSYMNPQNSKRILYDRNFMREILPFQINKDTYVKYNIENMFESDAEKS